MRAIAGPDLELIIDRVRNCKLPEIQDYVLEQTEQDPDDDHGFSPSITVVSGLDPRPACAGVVVGPA